MADKGDTVTEWLTKEIARHRLWRQIWSASYFAVAAFTVIAGALTTASAGIFSDTSDGMVQTTWLAAITTILASLEKVLRLRDKWDLHRNIHVSLELIEIRYTSGLIDIEEAVNQLEKTGQLYSQQLTDLTSSGNNQ